MRRQTHRAVADSDVVLFVIDPHARIARLDKHFADWLRRGKTPVVLLANKAEGRAGTGGSFEAFELGMGAPIAISAEHGEGLADLYEALAPFARPAEPDAAIPEAPAAEDEHRIQLAIVGRPNVGKSTLVNRLIGEERMLTGPEAGITRDAIAIDWKWRDHQFRIIDTAGMRRRARVELAIRTGSFGPA